MICQLIGFREINTARILQKYPAMKTILLCAAIVAAIAIALAARIIRNEAGVPSLDDPKNVTPPPARDMGQRTRRGECS